MSSGQIVTDYKNKKDSAPSKEKTTIVNSKIGIIILFAIVVWVGLAWLIHSYNNVITTAEVIVIIALLIAIGRLSWYWIRKIIRDSTASNKSVALRVESECGYTTITCKIANNDIRRIKPKYIYLFIEKGIEPKDDDETIDVKFPFLLCHQNNGASDCQLGAQCKVSAKVGKKLDEFPPGIVPKEFQTFECGKRHVITLDELCQEGRHYIDPGEEFAQDVVVKLSKGVYRATVIWTSEGDDDCICATKVFVVLP